MQGFIKHSFVSMPVTQNLFVSVFVHKCLMMMNAVEYTTFKMFVRQMCTYRHRRQAADLPAKVAKRIGCAYKRGCSLETGWSPIFVKILGHNFWS